LREVALGGEVSETLTATWRYEEERTGLLEDSEMGMRKFQSRDDGVTASLRASHQSGSGDGSGSSSDGGHGHAQGQGQGQVGKRKNRMRPVSGKVSEREMAAMRFLSYFDHMTSRLLSTLMTLSHSPHESVLYSHDLAGLSLDIIYDRPFLREVASTYGLDVVVASVEEEERDYQKEMKRATGATTGTNESNLATIASLAGTGLGFAFNAIVSATKKWSEEL
jgi:carbohydrate-selective porin OprB